MSKTKETFINPGIFQDGNEMQDYFAYKVEALVKFNKLSSEAGYNLKYVSSNDFIFNEEKYKVMFAHEHKDSDGRKQLRVITVGDRKLFVEKF